MPMAAAMPAAMPASLADMPAEDSAATERGDPSPQPTDNLAEPAGRAEKPQPSRPAVGSPRREYGRLFAKLLRNA